MPGLSPEVYQTNQICRKTMGIVALSGAGGSGASARGLAVFGVPSLVLEFGVIRSLANTRLPCWAANWRSLGCRGVLAVVFGLLEKQKKPLNIGFLPS